MVPLSVALGLEDSPGSLRAIIAANTVLAAARAEIETELVGVYRKEGRDGPFADQVTARALVELLRRSL